MAKNKDKSPRTKSTIIYCLKAIFNQAIEDGIITVNPARGLKRNLDDAEERRALTEVEDAATLKYIAEHPGTDEALFLAMIYYSGAREGEACGPQWKHMDFSNRKIKIDQQLVYSPADKEAGIHNGKITKHLKTKRSRREIPMRSALAAILEPLRGLPNVYLFRDGNSHYKHSSMLRLWVHIVDDCPELSEISPHYYRHNYATWLYMQGVPVDEAAEYVGETIEVMMRTYVDFKKKYRLKSDSISKAAFE